MTVEQMASVVHGSRATVRVMAVIQAFCDETGFGEEAFALAAYVAPCEDWKPFVAPWEKLLANPCCVEEKKYCGPLPFLHAAEMVGCGKGQFRRLGWNNIEHLVKRSVSIILESPIIGVSGAVVMSAYDRLPPQARKSVGDPYLMCMRYVMQTVAEKARMFLGEKDEKIAYIFEKSPRWQAKIHDLWTTLEMESKDAFRMGTLAFADKGEFRGNEAADRLAYELHRKMLGSPTPMWNRIISNRERYFGHYVDDEGAAGLLRDLECAGII